MKSHATLIVPDARDFSYETRPLSSEQTVLPTQKMNRNLTFVQRSKGQFGCFAASPIVASVLPPDSFCPCTTCLWTRTRPKARLSTESGFWVWQPMAPCGSTTWSSMPKSCLTSKNTLRTASPSAPCRDRPGTGGTTEPGLLCSQSRTGYSLVLPSNGFKWICVFLHFCLFNEM